MAMATTYGAMPEAEHSAQLRKAVIASTVGTAIEWYDFFLYGTMAGLVFGKRPRERLLVREVELAKDEAGHRAVEEKVVPLDCRADR